MTQSTKIRYVVNMADDVRRVVATLDMRVMKPMLVEGMMDLLTCLSGGQLHMLLKPEELPDDVRNNSFEFLCVETTVADVLAWCDAVDEAIMSGNSAEIPDLDVHIALGIIEAKEAYMQEMQNGEDQQGSPG